MLFAWGIYSKWNAYVWSFNAAQRFFGPVQQLFLSAFTKQKEGRKRISRKIHFLYVLQCVKWVCVCVASEIDLIRFDSMRYEFVNAIFSIKAISVGSRVWMSILIIAIDKRPNGWFDGNSTISLRDEIAPCDLFDLSRVNQCSPFMF